MITNLVIHNYKRFKDLNLSLNKDLNILVGDNESGKSTILECINLGLNFKINGRYAHTELTSFLFNRDVVVEYVRDIKTNPNAALPEIFIELYMEAEESVNHLKGSMNSLKKDTPGVKVHIRFNEDFRVEYSNFVKTNKDKISTIPIEYYDAIWLSFADDPITSRSMPVVSTVLDAINIRLQTGTDSYIKSVINEGLDNKQKAELTLAYRSLKESFLEDPSILSINSILETRRGDITEKTLAVSLDVSQRNSWDSHLIPYLDHVPFHYSGMGEQNSLKLLLTLNKDVDSSQIILIEELENHLSFSTMAKLLKRIKDKCAGKQIIITTHSTYVLNKLGVNNLILVSRDRPVSKLSDLKPETMDYFEKLPGYDTLRLVLAKQAILVEGPSDELIVQRAYLDKHGHLPIEKGIDVITVRGLSFKRFLDIAVLVGTVTSVVTDNDGNYDEKITKKYKEYETQANIKIFASNNNSLKTLEPQIVDCNELSVINTVLGKTFANKDEAVEYMTKSDNKTDCALKIFASTIKITFPQYVKDAIEG